MRSACACRLVPSMWINRWMDPLPGDANTAGSMANPWAMEWHTLAVSRPALRCIASQIHALHSNKVAEHQCPRHCGRRCTSKDNMIAGRRNDDEAMIIAAAFGR